MQLDPLRGGEVDLLGQLAMSGGERLLALHVEQPGRAAPRSRSADRMPVLVDDDHPIVLVDREDGDGTRVIDVLAHELVVAEARGGRG